MLFHLTFLIWLAARSFWGLINGPAFPVTLLNEATLWYTSQVSKSSAVYTEQGLLTRTYLVNFFNIFIKRAVGGLGLELQLLLDFNSTRPGVSHRLLFPQ